MRLSNVVFGSAWQGDSQSIGVSLMILCKCITPEGLVKTHQQMHGWLVEHYNGSDLSVVGHHFAWHGPRPGVGIYCSSGTWRSRAGQNA